MNQKAYKILIIDDDADVLHSAGMFLKQYFTEVTTEPDPTRINHLISRNKFDIVLLDMNFKRGEHDGREGLYWLERILTIAPQTGVVLITAYGDVELAVEAMRMGAANFVLKPWKNNKLLEAIQTTLARQQHSRQSSAKKTAIANFEMIGDSPAMQQVYALINKVANTDANVLIMGENGTGKELVARALHDQSSRRESPFIRVDVGALTPSLFESEMFGHVKGAFTDAYQDKAGKFEMAAGGTLFLDEIGNLSPPQQVKLLTAIQNRKVIRIGSNQERTVDVRLICATNMPLYDMVNEHNSTQEGSFRQDLLYRINTVEVFVPPLRERSGDIPLLAEHFLHKYREKYNKFGLCLHDVALDKLKKYSWPGNIRELEHAIERAVILCEGTTIDAHGFDLNSAGSVFNVSASTTLDENERNFIKQALQRNQGNVTKTAKELGITRTALYRRLDKYGL